MKRGKEILTTKTDYEGDKQSRALYNSTTTAMALRWIRMARDSIQVKFRMKSEVLREDLMFVLSSMKPEDDWYYTSAARLEGKDILRQMTQLEDDRRILEAETAVKINKFEEDLRNYLEDKSQGL